MLLVDGDEILPNFDAESLAIVAEAYEPLAELVENFEVWVGLQNETPCKLKSNDTPETLNY